MAQSGQPDWWDWPIELSPHLVRRMQERGFDEAELREMLADAHAIDPDVAPGRFLVRTKHAGRNWEIVVEPDPVDRVVVIVTAYRRRSDARVR
jgi:hypothetical protein